MDINTDESWLCGGPPGDAVNSGCRAVVSRVPCAAVCGSLPMGLLHGEHWKYYFTLCEYWLYYHSIRFDLSDKFLE